MQNRPASGRWAKISEAAKALGVSPITVRRSLKRGELDGKQVSTPHGPTWLVWMEDEAQVSGSSDTVSLVTDVSGVAELVRLIDKLRLENQRLADEVGYLRAHLEHARA